MSVGVHLKDITILIMEVHLIRNTFCILSIGYAFVEYSFMEINAI